jgi:hypothetical protein
MESEAINSALHSYLVAVLRARDCSDDLALERERASHYRAEPAADIDEIEDGEDDRLAARRRLPRNMCR